MMADEGDDDDDDGGICKKSRLNLVLWCTTYK